MTKRSSKAAGDAARNNYGFVRKNDKSFFPGKDEGSGWRFLVFGFEGMTLGVILDSSMVEHAAVNRGVVGSSPTRGV